jgi:hypothetical protein
MIICEIGGCACVLYGPIYKYYDNQNQFEGPLAFPTSDVTQLKDGTHYAVFDNTVIYLDAQGNISQLQPLSPSLLKGLTQSSAYPSGIDGSIGQITQIAQQKVQNLANNALQTNQQLRDNVSSITPTVQFDHVGQGACGNATAFSGMGTPSAVCREHIFKVHYDFSLSGCKSAAGSASADTHVTIQITVNPPNVQAFLRTYTIDAVSSPFGVANDQITSGLTQAMANVYGQDLLGVSAPSGFSALAVIVDTSGNVAVYLQPGCSASTALLQVSPRLADSALPRLRRLRDDFIVRQPYGKDILTIIDVLGPILINRLRREEMTSPRGKPFELSSTVAAILSDPDVNGDAVHKELDEVCTRLVELQHTLGEDGGRVIEHMLEIGVDFVRARSSAPPTAARALAAFKLILDKEPRHHEKPR